MRAWRVGCVLLLAVGLAAGCGSDEEKLAEHLAAAQELRVAGDLQEALLELRSALQIDPNNAAVNFEIAELMMRGRAIEDALFYYQEARRLDPSMLPAALGEARLLLGTEVDEARELLAEILERDPTNVSARVMLSQAGIVSEDLDGALTEALTAVEIGDDDPEALLQLGIVYMAQIGEAIRRKEEPEEAAWQNALASFEQAVASEQAGESRHALRAAIERASLLGSWEARRSEAPEAFKEAYRKVEAWKGAERKEMLQSALAAARRYSQGVKDTATERWAIEQSLELEPTVIRQWQRLATLVDGMNAQPSTVLARMVETVPELPAAHIAYSRDLAARGHQDLALAHLEESVSKASRSERILGEIVSQQIQNGDLPAAKVTSERLVTEFADTPDALRAQARVAEAEGRETDAADLYRTLIQLEENPTDLFRLSSVETRLGRMRVALGHVDQALALVQPTGKFHLRCLRQKARLQARLGDHAGALVTFRRVFRRQRGQVSLRDLLPATRAAYGAGQEQVARQLLERFFRLDEPPADAVLLFAQKEYGNQPELARKRLAAALEREPGEVRLIRMAVALDLRDRKPDRATERLVRAVEKQPDSGILHRLLAKQLVRVGDKEKALSHAERSLELEPDQPGSVKLVVQLLTRLGRQSEVMERLTKQEEAGTLDASGRIMLARLHSSRGERGRAIELLEAALAERSDLPGAKNDLAYHLTVSGGDLDRALSLAQEARQALPRSTGAADTLGFVYLQRKIPEAAAVQFEEAIELAQEQTRAWAVAQHHLGLALREMGRPQAAVEAFELALAAAVEYPEVEETRAAIKELSQGEG